MTERKMKLSFLLECEVPENADVDEVHGLILFNLTENGQPQWHGDPVFDQVTSIHVSLISKE